MEIKRCLNRTPTEQEVTPTINMGDYSKLQSLFQISTAHENKQQRDSLHNGENTYLLLLEQRTIPTLD